MQNLIKTANIAGSYVASSAAYAGALIALFLFAGVSTAYADTNYVVDSSGACGTVCQNLQNYLSGNTTPSYDYSKYSSTDVPFFDVYTGGSSNGNTAGNNGSPYQNSGANTYGANYSGSAASAPYLVYNYLPTAAPKYTNPSLNEYNSQYVNPPMYTYYGVSNPTTVKSYSQTAYGQQNLYGSSKPVSKGSGFIMTSGY